MLDREAVARRLADQGISYTEFSYVLLQSMDYLELFRRYGCRLQTGGSDQFGNIVAGVDLVRRVEGASVHALTTPLMTKADGTKFGKTEGGAVWLDANLTSPYAFYQFWLNTDDRDVERLLNFFTFLDAERIAEVMQVQAADASRRTAQRVLAEDITLRVHGPDTTGRVIAASGILFGGTDLRSADAGVFEVLTGEMPTTTLPPDLLDTGLPLVDALVTSGLASSKSDARRGIQGKGFAVNGEKTDDVERLLTTGDLLPGGFVMLQKGKKNYALLRIG
jgi:tyrosyl-tRNA synthetase